MKKGEKGGVKIIKTPAFRSQPPKNKGIKENKREKNRQMNKAEIKKKWEK